MSHSLYLFFFCSCVTHVVKTDSFDAIMTLKMVYKPNFKAFHSLWINAIFKSFYYVIMFVSLAIQFDNTKNPIFLIPMGLNYFFFRTSSAILKCIILSVKLRSFFANFGLVCTDFVFFFIVFGFCFFFGGKIFDWIIFGLGLASRLSWNNCYCCCILQMQSFDIH